MEMPRWWEVDGASCGGRRDVGPRGGLWHVASLRYEERNAGILPASPQNDKMRVVEAAVAMLIFRSEGASE